MTFLSKRFRSSPTHFYFTFVVVVVDCVDALQNDTRSDLLLGPVSGRFRGLRRYFCRPRASGKYFSPRVWLAYK
jgi:hypothetical protein